MINDHMRQGDSTVSMKEHWTTPSCLITIQAWAAEGATIKNIAERIGVSRSTFYKWRKDDPSLEEALSKGSAQANKEVEKSLFLRAVGYDYEEIKYKNVYDPIAREHRQVEESRVKKHMPGDTTAMMFWLRNRVPEKYRYNTPRELNGIQAHPSYSTWEKWMGVDWQAWQDGLKEQRRTLERIDPTKKKKK